MKREEFFRLLEEATEVRSDPRGWYLVRLPGEGWRLFYLAPLEAHRPGGPEEAPGEPPGGGLWSLSGSAPRALDEPLAGGGVRGLVALLFLGLALAQGVPRVQEVGEREAY
jgi:hypothetical protein